MVLCWLHWTLSGQLWWYSDQRAGGTEHPAPSGSGGLCCGSVGAGSTAQMVFILAWLLCVCICWLKILLAVFCSNIKKYYKSLTANKNCANVFRNPSLTKQHGSVDAIYARTGKSEPMTYSWQPSPWLPLVLESDLTSYPGLLPLPTHTPERALL